MQQRAPSSSRQRRSRSDPRLRRGEEEYVPVTQEEYLANFPPQIKTRPPVKPTGTERGEERVGRGPVRSRTPPGPRPPQDKSMVGTPSPEETDEEKKEEKEEEEEAKEEGKEKEEKKEEKEDEKEVKEEEEAEKEKAEEASYEAENSPPIPPPATPPLDPVKEEDEER